MQLLVKGEIFERSQSSFDPGLMTEIEQIGMVLITAMANIFTIPAHFTGKRLRQPSQQAQQAGLAYPVGTFNLHQITGNYRKGEMFKQSAIFTHAAQIVNLKQHGDFFRENEAACILTQYWNTSFPRCPSSTVFVEKIAHKRK